MCVYKCVYVIMHNNAITSLKNKLESWPGKNDHIVCLIKMGYGEGTREKTVVLVRWLLLKSMREVVFRVQRQPDTADNLNIDPVGFANGLH